MYGEWKTRKKAETRRQKLEIGETDGGETGKQKLEKEEGGREGKPPIGISAFPEVSRRGCSVGFTRHVSMEVTYCQVKLKPLKRKNLER